MKKLVVLLTILLLAIGTGCSRWPSASINPKIQTAYLSSVAIVDENNKAFGSGTIIMNRKGYQLVVLTAAHVIRGMHERGLEKIYVIPAYSKTKKRVKLYKADYKVDLALLLGYPKEKRNGPYAKLANKGPNIGDPVWAIGSPLGSKWTVSDGIISKFEAFNGQIYYRVNAHVFFGNSGGGLFNEKNELIGVVAKIQIIQVGFSVIVVPGASFAVTIRTVKRFM